MSYKSGDLESSTDEDGDMYHHAEAKNPRPLVWLPHNHCGRHSCDPWVIGGLAEARALAADLAVAIKAMEGDS